jgi:eukaryotic-like serine/threonine-protein kinase
MLHSEQKVRDYVLEDKIGEGGMGEVWSARHSVLHRQVAIKVMARQLAADPRFGERFLQEARAQAALEHPRILGVTDFFAEDGVYYLVMPLMSGESLAQRIDRTAGPLPQAEALAIARDILDALDYAHRRGVIHRDVKPSNIMLDPAGHAYLMDFGIALALGQQRVTRTGTSLGTPHYISPEQIKNAKTLDHRADVYSLGCVLYEMLAGRTPFLAAEDEGDTDFALKEAHLYKQPEPIRTVNPAVAPGLDEAVLRALKKNPDERYGGCGEFRRALEAWDRPAPAAPAAAPAPQPAGVLWYYAKDNQRLGPVPEAELRRLIAGGQVARTDLVWNQSLTHWVRAFEIASLFPTPPPPPRTPVAPSPGPQAIASARPALPSPAGTSYASFGQRLGAFLIDAVLVLVLSFGAGFALGILLLLSGKPWGPGMTNLSNLLGFIVNWLYFAGFESSQLMATPGKRALGLAVTDLAGRRLDFGRATGRWFCKLLSVISLGIGYLAMLFSPRQQTWHDSLSGCLVLQVR